MKYFLILLIFITGCANLKKKEALPPSVSTAQVVQSLEETKSELIKAGESNTKVATNINKALTLAERLEKLLEEIEKEKELLKGETK
jgi:redox-regulated HSP33 family molecular chaperone